MIKGRLPYPLETIGLAVSFSPGLPLLIGQMKRLSELHGAMAVFIHAGKKTSEKQRDLSNLLTENGFSDINSRVYWDPGETVATVLRICKHEVIDLLLVGASDRADFRLPVGQTAHAIALKAKCSVLVYSGAGSGTFKKLVVNGSEHHKTDMTIQTAKYFAEKEKSEFIKIIGDKDNEVQDGYYVGQVARSINKTLEKSDVSINHLANNNSNSITDFAIENHADLLITNSSDHHLLIFDRISSKNGLDSMMKVMPCSMLIVHSRTRD